MQASSRRSSVTGLSGSNSVPNAARAVVTTARKSGKRKGAAAAVPGVGDPVVGVVGGMLIMFLSLWMLG